MTNKINSLWGATAPPPEHPVPLEGEITCDVAVIGGGFTGLHASLTLAEAGTDVAIFEANHVGFGASGRSGGQVNPMLPTARPEDLRKAVGTTYFERMTEVSLRSADDLFDLIRRHQIQCDARQLGWLRVDHSPQARDVARRNAKLWNEHGAEFTFLERDDVVSQAGIHSYGSGTLTPRGGAVQPMSLVRGLDRAVRAAGGKVFSYAPAAKMQRIGDHWHFIAGGHPVTARTIIVATNGYSDALVPKLKGSVLPLTPVQMATEPLPPEQIDTIMKSGQTVSDTRRMIIYTRREPDNRIVFGGMGYRRPLGGIGGFNWMKKDVLRCFPTLRGVNWAYQWGGQIALTDDRVPHLHEPAPGLIAGLGYNGRGVAMSRVIGQVMAERALGKDQGQLSLPVTTLTSYPFRTPQILGAGLAMAWMRYLDEREARSSGTR